MTLSPKRSMSFVGKGESVKVRANLRFVSAFALAFALALFSGCSREEAAAEKQQRTSPSAAEKRAGDKVYVHKLDEFRARQAKDASAIAAVRRQIAALGEHPETKPEHASLTNRLAQLEAARAKTNRAAAAAVRARILQDSPRKPSSPDGSGK